MADEVADRAGSAALPVPRGLDLTMLIVAVAGVSFSGPLIAATAAPALAIAFWRNAMGGTVTAIYAGLRRAGELRRADRRTWLISMAAGLALAAHFATWIPSLTLTTVASSTALVSVQSVFAALIAARRGLRLPRPAWIGMIVAVLGAALVTGSDVAVSSRALAGDLLALLGGLFAAIYVTIGSAARARVSTGSYTAICYVSCALILLVVCVTGGVRLSGYSGDAWVKLALITLSAQLLGHSVFSVVLRSLGPTVVSLAILFEPIGAALIAFGWLHQRPPLSAIPGIVLLLAGIGLVARANRAPATDVPA